MKLLWIVPLCICSAVPVRADVTVRYQTDMQLNLPAPAKEAAQKSIQSTLARFANPTIRMKNGKAINETGSFTSIIDYATKQVTLIDREHKTFATLSLADFHDQAAAAIPDMPEDAQKALQNVQTTVESKKTGKSDTISGIHAEETETVMQMQIPTPPEHPGGMSMKLVMHIWTATQEETLRNQAVREFTGYKLYANRFMNPAAMLQKMASLPMAKDLSSLVNENAMMLRMQMETFIQLPPEAAAVMQKMGADPNTPMSTMTMDASEVSSATLEDAIFQVPVDFQKVESSLLLKQLISGK